MLECWRDRETQGQMLTSTQENNGMGMGLGWGARGNGSGNHTFITCYVGMVCPS